MDDYEISEVKAPPKRKKSRARLWNILTIFILVTLLCFLSYFAVIFFNPDSSLNPFPPPTLNPALYTLTPSVTPRFTLVPSWTPTKAAVQATETPAPSETPIPPAIMVDNPTKVEPVVAESSKDYPFVVQQGSPSAIAAADFHQTTACDWSAVAGQATSLNGEAVKGLFVQLGGSLPGGESMDNLAMTGLAPQYGQGGFEITLANRLFASTGTLWIQLLDQQNLPLSDRIYFDTYDDCQKNLVIIYFSQIR
jgi:hypothetical protein